MEKTRIDWCDSTWNPVTGCEHGCEYCYARGIVKRFGGHKDLDYFMETEENPELKEQKLHVLDKPLAKHDLEASVAPYPFYFEPTLYRYRLDEYQKKRRTRNIFVCSMADLFGKWVPDEWIEVVFEACKKAPQHNYLFLTKNPGRYIELEKDRRLPWADNFWFGSSVTKLSDRYTWFTEKKFHWFLSVEPILEDLGPMDVDAPKPEWVIVGAETGQRKDKVVPERAWIESLLEECRKYDIPIFMKSGLSDIWGEPLIQEFPEQLRKAVKHNDI